MVIFGSGRRLLCTRQSAFALANMPSDKNTNTSITILRGSKTSENVWGIASPWQHWLCTKL